MRIVVVIECRVDIPDDHQADIAERSRDRSRFSKPGRLLGDGGVGVESGFAETPIDPGYYLNNLSRGWVVYLYTCDSDCAEIEAQLRGYLLPGEVPRSEGKAVRVRDLRPKD